MDTGWSAQRSVHLSMLDGPHKIMQHSVTTKATHETDDSEVDLDVIGMLNLSGHSMALTRGLACQVSLVSLHEHLSQPSLVRLHSRR